MQRVASNNYHSFLFTLFFITTGTCSFLMSGTGAITNLHNTKDCKDTEQYLHYNTEPERGSPPTMVLCNTKNNTPKIDVSTVMTIEGCRSVWHKDPDTQESHSSFPSCFQYLMTGSYTQQVMGYIVPGDSDQNLNTVNALYLRYPLDCSLRSKRFRALSEQRERNESQRQREKWRE